MSLIMSFPASVIPYLRNGSGYILDNYTSEWAISLYNIFENRIFHETVINPEFSRDVKSLQKAFSFASAPWVIYDIYLATHYLNALSVVAGICMATYITNKIFNRCYPLEENDQKNLTVEIPEKIKQNIKVSLIRQTNEYLQTLYLARMFLNIYLAYITPHTIPYSINVLCLIHILSTEMVKTRWLKFSRTFSYLTRDECFRRLAELTPLQQQIGNFRLPAKFDEIPEEIFEEFLDQLRQIQVPNPSFTFNFRVEPR